jgi:transposase
MEVEEMKFPLREPPYMVRNSEADLFTDQKMFYRPLWKRIASRIRSMIAF